VRWYGVILLYLDGSGTVLDGHVVGHFDELFMGNLKISKQSLLP
jgi:hypothetical protein